MILSKLKINELLIRAATLSRGKPMLSPKEIADLVLEEENERKRNNSEM